MTKESIKTFIKEQAKKFHNSAKDNHRFLSWEHCYSFFLNNKENLKDDASIDLAALNLAFYLASWGMYRGSSFLLQYDYKIFIPMNRCNHYIAGCGDIGLSETIRYVCEKVDSFL